MRISIKSIVWVPLVVAVACSGCQQQDSKMAKPDANPAAKKKQDDQVASPVKKEVIEEPLFTVDIYDPKRDSAADLKMTVAKATKSKKRILLEVGGKW